MAKKKPKPPAAQPAEQSGVNISGSRLSIGGDLVGRDKITGKIVVHVGTLIVPAAPLIVAAALAVAALVAVVFITRPATPVGPARMPGAFNVAVADFGQVGADGRVQPSEDGRLLSQWVFESIEAQKDAFPDANVKSVIAIWHDSLPASEKGTTLGAVATITEAEQLAGRIGADLVIYGALDVAGSFNPEFYISPRLRGEIDAATGRHRLGADPIRVDPNARLGVSADLTARTSGLFWLMMGLTYDLFGRSQQALDVFRQAETELDNWQGRGEGKEILYFFKGRAALFLSQQQSDPQDAIELEQEAQGDLETALRINPEYARAHIGLGSLYFLRAQRTPPENRLDAPELAQAMAEYETALSLASQSPAEIEILATLALGIAYRSEGEAYLHAEQYTEADRVYDKAIEEINTTLNHLAGTEQFRLVGQAYLALGTAYAQKADVARAQGDTARTLTLYEEARRAYANCIAQQDRAREAGAGDDQVLNQTVIADKCVPYDRIAEDALNALGGGP